MSITTKLLCCKKGNTVYKYHLHTNAVTTPYIAVKCEYNGSVRKLACPIREPYKVLNYTINPDGLHVRKGGKTYFAYDALPALQVSYTITDDPQPYKDRYYCSQLVLKFSISGVSTGNSIKLQHRETNSSAWYTYLTTVPGSSEVSYLGTFRIANTGSWRYSYGSWVSSTFNLNTGSGTTSAIAVPEEQWGVGV